MVKLIPLKCAGCGQNLSFKSKDELLECANCSTRYILDSDEQGVLFPVSFLPLPENSREMQVPLKIRIAKMLRGVDSLFVGDDVLGKDSFFGQYVDFEGGVIVPRGWWPERVNRDGKLLVIHAWGNDRNSWGYAEIVLISIRKVSTKSVGVGEAVEVEVLNEKYEDWGKKISLLIQNAFGVIPSVVLVEG